MDTIYIKDQLLSDSCWTVVTMAVVLLIQCI